MKAKRKKLSNIIDKDIKEKELGIFNFSIKIHILHSLVLLNLSTLNTIKQKLILLLILSILNPTKYDSQNSFYQTKSKKDQYLISFFLNNQFTTNIKSDDKRNNAISIIKGLFLNLRYRSSYKKLIEKMIYEICKFFMHFIRYMSSKDQLALYKINLRLRPF